MDEVGWLDADEQRVWRRFVDIPIRLGARLDRELQLAHGLSMADYIVLVHLSEAPGRSLRMSELAALLLLSPSGLTRRLDGLVRAGLVERRSCPSDRRGALGALTPKGAARLEEAAPTHVAGVRRYVIDALGADGLRDLGAVLGRIDTALGERDAPCAPTERDAPCAQWGEDPDTSDQPCSRQPLVPEATDTAR